jgi:hypothetical protein
MAREFTVDREGRGRARLKTLDDLDHRTTACRRALSFVSQLESDLGGDPTVAQRELAKRAGALSAILEDFETRWWLKEEQDQSLADYLSGCNVQRRILATLCPGLARVPKTVEDPALAEFDAEMARLDALDAEQEDNAASEDAP